MSKTKPAARPYAPHTWRFLSLQRWRSHAFYCDPASWTATWATVHGALTTWIVPAHILLLVTSILAGVNGLLASPEATALWRSCSPRISDFDFALSVGLARVIALCAIYSLAYSEYFN